MKTEQNEDEYVEYKCSPDNRLMGEKLGKAFNKDLKKDISKFTSAQLRDYIKNGSLTHNGLKIEKDWLKVEKIFNKKYQSSKDFACASNLTSCVLLETKMDENLINMGHAREVTNRIQKMRKSVGISIDDQIEVFYKTVSAGSQLTKVIQDHGD